MQYSRSREQSVIISIYVTLYMLYTFVQAQTKLDISTAHRRLKSSRSLSGTSTHLTKIT